MRKLLRIALSCSRAFDSLRASTLFAAASFSFSANLMRNILLADLIEVFSQNQREEVLQLKMRLHDNWRRRRAPVVWRHLTVLTAAKPPALGRRRASKKTCNSLNLHSEAN